MEDIILVRGQWAVIDDDTDAEYPVIAWKVDDSRSELTPMFNLGGTQVIAATGPHLRLERR
jgi:hypothetical protein